MLIQYNHTICPIQTLSLSLIIIQLEVKLMNLPCYLTLYALSVLVFLQRESAHSHIIKHTHMHTQIIFLHFCQRKCILLVPQNNALLN